MELREEEINNLLLDPSFRNWALRLNVQDFEKWENILEDDSEFNQLATEAKQVVLQIELSDNKQLPEDVESFERLEKKRKNVIKEIPINSVHVARSYRLGFNHIIKIAAVLSFIIVFSGLLYFNTRNTEQPAQSVAETINKQTQNGQQLTITLPDGSKVKLNSNSSISYPKAFFKNRRIKLEGEAFFSVVRDKSNPFIVKTETFQTEVLGTSFNISAYKHADAKISVAEGTVKVSSFFDNSGKNFKILKKEEAAGIDDKQIIDSDFDMDELLWKEGILVFSNENIHTITAKIQRWFNVVVTVNNEALIAGDFSGKYSNVSLEEILTGMGFALNFSFEMEGSEIIINGKK